MTFGGLTEMTPNRNSYPGIITLLYIFLLFSTESPAQTKQIVVDSATQFEYCQSLMKEGKYETAFFELERFIHFFPDDARVPLADLQRGMCRLKSRRFDDAIDIFLKIIDSGRTAEITAQALLLLSESYYLQGVFTEAEYYLNKIIHDLPGSDYVDTARYRLGWTLLQQGRWQEASAAFRHVEEGGSFYESARELETQSLRGNDLPQKKPMVAGVLAALLPGAGHAYVSRYRDALTAFVVNGLFVWATMESFHQDHDVLGGILAAVELGWYSGNIYSAVNSANKYNQKVRRDYVKGLKDRFDIAVLGAYGKGAGLFFTFRF